MGKTTEPRYDVAMTHGVIVKTLAGCFQSRRSFLQKTAKGIDGLLLHPQILGVLQGEIEEGLFQGGEGAVVSCAKPCKGQLQGLGIMGVGRRCFAMDVAGELVEEHDEGKAPPGRAAPGVEFSPCPPLDQVFEPFADPPVRLVSAGEPEAKAFRWDGSLGGNVAEPEVQKVLEHGVAFRRRVFFK